MNLICNGIQKHGTHALWKAVECLGQPLKNNFQEGAELHHMSFRELPADQKHLFIIRHPKNAFISWMRSHNYQMIQGLLMAKLQSFEECSYVEHCEPYLGWLTDPNTLVVRYEDLISKPDTFKDIAEHLEVPFLEDAFLGLPCHTATWNPDHSDYSKVAGWTDVVEDVWQSIGGIELERQFGYGS